MSLLQHKIEPRCILPYARIDPPLNVTRICIAPHLKSTQNGIFLPIHRFTTFTFGTKAKNIKNNRLQMYRQTFSAMPDSKISIKQHDKKAKPKGDRRHITQNAKKTVPFESISVASARSITASVMERTHFSGVTNDISVKPIPLLTWNEGQFQNCKSIIH